MFPINLAFHNSHSPLPPMVSFPLIGISNVTVLNAQWNDNGKFTSVYPWDLTKNQNSVLLIFFAKLSNGVKEDERHRKTESRDIGTNQRNAA